MVLALRSIFAPIGWLQLCGSRKADTITEIQFVTLRVGLIKMRERLHVRNALGTGGSVIHPPAVTASCVRNCEALLWSCLPKARR